MIFVTKPYLPKKEEYIKYIDQIWESNQLTNAGPLVLELENKLKKYLENDSFHLLNNGTIALQIAIKALDITGEIITTPFSYVATTSSIIWEDCVPVFADIEDDYLTINPDEIRKKITNKTSAIIATHVYGNPCNIEEIKSIAKEYDLKVIYDAAHCFGVKYKSIPIVNYGDISTLSFHATKLFHTAEGGGIISNCGDVVSHKISYLRNFGHDGYDGFFGVGINGKNSELHAAMGLCVLPDIENIINYRKNICSIYDDLLFGLEYIKKPKIRDNTEYNYSYYPVIIESEKLLLDIIKRLNLNDIYPRRYFYPSLNKLNYVNNQSMPTSEDISKRILCLPLYSSLQNDQISKICNIIKVTS